MSELAYTDVRGRLQAFGQRYWVGSEAVDSLNLLISAADSEQVPLTSGLIIGGRAREPVPFATERDECHSLGVLVARARCCQLDKPAIAWPGDRSWCADPRLAPDHAPSPGV